MFKLDENITIHPDPYDGLMIVRFEGDMRTQMVRVYLAPVQSDETMVSLGVEELTDQGAEYLFPEIIRSVELTQNLQDPDPLIDQLMTAFAQFLENIEQVIIANQDEAGGLAMTPYQIGTKKWSLASTFEALGERTIGRTIRDLRTPPPEP